MELMDLLDRNPELGLECIIHTKVSTVGTEEDIHECVSDVFMDFFLKKESMDQSKGSVKGYLAVIAKHKGIDLYRKLSRAAGRSTDYKENWESLEDTRVNLEQSVIAREEKSLILGALNSLGEPDREIIIRKYYFGQKTKEIAGMLNLRENTVDKKISRGLKKLKILLGGVDNGREDKIYAK